MNKIFLLMTASLIALEAGTVRLVNDSVFKLEAEIKGADGSSLSKLTLNSQQSMTWDDYSGGRGSYNQSRTPYTVLWYCPSGETFGIASNVPSGGVTSALASSGDRACKIKKQDPSQSNGKQKALPTNPGDALLQRQEEEEQKDVGPPEGLLD